KHFLPRGSEIARRRIFFEKPGSHFVDPLIRTLRRKDGRDQQFPRVAMMQRARRFWIHLVEILEDRRDAGLSLGLIFWLRDFGDSRGRHYSYRKTSTGVIRVALRAG